MLRLILCLLCLLSPHALAERERLFIAAHDYYPYIYQDEGILKGPCVEIVKTAFHTKERDVYADFSDPIDYETVALFVLKDSDIVFDGDLSKLSQYSFGIPRGYSTGHQLDRAIEERVISKIVGTGTAERAHKMLLLGRFDIMPANRATAWLTFARLGFADQVRELKPALTTLPVHLIFSKKRDLADVVKQFNAELARMKADGSYEQIMRRNRMLLPALESPVE